MFLTYQYVKIIYACWKELISLRYCVLYVVVFSDKCLQSPRQIGPCYDYVMQYSYVSSTGHCEAFYYGGCEGNDNRFESREECETQCMKETTTPASTGYYVYSLFWQSLNFENLYFSWKNLNNIHAYCKIIRTTPERESYKRYNI